MSLSPPGVRLFYDPRGHHAGAINELCWGLEEQGVPCQTITYDGGGDAAALGALAARSSPLRVGIGLSASGEIALTHAQLPTRRWLPDTSPIATIICVRSAPTPGSWLKSCR